MATQILVKIRAIKLQYYTHVRLQLEKEALRVLNLLLLAT
jgi:hypothetical protein